MRFKIRFIVLSVIFCGLFFLNTEATAAGISNSCFRSSGTRTANTVYGTAFHFAASNDSYRPIIL